MTFGHEGGYAFNEDQRGGHDERTDRERFAMMAGHCRTIAETMLREFFGERCPDFDVDCECCKRWKLLDELTQNPFDEPSV